MKMKSMEEKLKHNNMSENENEFRKIIGSKKAEALIRLKEIISDIGKVMSVRGEDGDSNVYISILTDRNRIREYMGRLGRYRTEDVMYLDHEAAAMVSYLHDYLCDLGTFIESHPDIPPLVTGIIAGRDIRMWSDKAESIIIRDMNAANTEIEEHSGDDWEAVKRRICDDLCENTALYHLPELPEETAGGTAAETDAAWMEWIEDFLKE